MRATASPRRSLRVEQLEDRSVPATIMVTTASDTGAGSLRAAISAANNETTNPGADTIEFTAALAGQSINLTTISDTSIGASALVITSEVTIAGTGQTITRFGGTAFRLFAVTGGGTLILHDLTLSNGLALGGAGGFPASGGGGGGGAAGLGGAIYNQGTLEISGCTFTGNQAVGGANFGGGAGGGGGLSGPGDADGNGGGPNGGLFNGLVGPGEDPTGTDGGFGGGGGAGENGAGETNARWGTSGGFGGGGGGGGVGIPGGPGPFDTGGSFGGNGRYGGFGGGGGGGGRGGTGDPNGALGDRGLGGFGGGDGANAVGASASGGGGGGAGMGGAVFTQGGTIHIANSTFTNNTARGGDAERGGGGSGFGAALLNLNGSVTLTNVTIAGNTVVAGLVLNGVGSEVDGQAAGAVYNLGSGVGSDITPGQNASLGVANCIFADTIGGPDLVNHAESFGQAHVNVGGPNIVSVAVENTENPIGGTPFTIADPLLGPLQDNGGPTQTMAPLAGSPALNTGSNTAATGLSVDQRGVARIAGGTVDIGAVEGGGELPQSVAAIANDQGVVVVFDSNTGEQLLSLRPFDTAANRYVGQMSVALGDVNNDGVADLIVATRGKRAGKVKVFDGTAATEGTASLIFTAFPVAGYKQGLTIASADVNGDSIDDIIAVSRRTNTLTGNPRPAAVVVFAGADTGTGGAPRSQPIVFAQPVGMIPDGLYVTAGDTTGDGKAEVIVSSSNRSLVKIFQVTGSTLTQLGGNLSPFGSGPFRAGAGDGQIRALDVDGDGISELVTGAVNGNTGTVTLKLLNSVGVQQASYGKSAGTTFFALDATDVDQDGADQVMLVTVAPGAPDAIDLLNPATGAAEGTLDSFLNLVGKVTVAGF